MKFSHMLWPAFLLAGMFLSCAPSTTSARAAFDADVSRLFKGDESKLKVVEFKRLDGTKMELLGMKIYVISVAGLIHWPDGLNVECFGARFSDKACSDKRTREVGEQENFQGQYAFVKTERGWTPDSTMSKVTFSQTDTMRAAVEPKKQERIREAKSRQEEEDRTRLDEERRRMAEAEASVKLAQTPSRLIEKMQYVSLPRSFSSSDVVVGQLVITDVGVELSDLGSPPEWRTARPFFAAFKKIEGYKFMGSGTPVPVEIRRENWPSQKVGGGRKGYFPIQVRAGSSYDYSLGFLSPDERDRAFRVLSESMRAWKAKYPQYARNPVEVDPNCYDRGNSKVPCDTTGKARY